MVKNRKDNKGRVLPPNISQLSDLRYIWRKTIDGQSYVIVDSNLGELKKKVVQKKADIQNNVCRDIDKSTLNQWFGKWLGIYKSNVKDVTKKNYTDYWKWYIQDSKLGKMQIGKIRRPHIVEHYKYLTEEKELSYGTLKYINSIVYSCLQDATEDKLILDNPCEGAIGKITKTEPMKRESLTNEQQASFIDFIANSSIYNVYLPLFSFMLGTGCRIGETLGMTWKDIDLKNNTISVNHTLSYRAINGKHEFLITTPKTSTGNREIPIIIDLQKQLLKQKENQFALGTKKDYEVNGYKNFVFTTSTGKPYTQESVNRVIRSIINAYNSMEIKNASEEKRKPQELPRFSAHTLRHTFCTRFCENESNIKVIQKIMGHARIETTMNIYAHVTKDKTEEAMNNLSGKIKIS